MPKQWDEQEDSQIQDKLQSGDSPWEIAKDLSPELNRTARAVDTRARRIRDDASERRTES